MSLASRATVAASTKRAAVVAGKRAAPATYLTGLLATPAYPADTNRAGELHQRLKMETPHQIWESYLLGHHDIVTGDTLVLGGQEYVIRAAAVWNTPSSMEPYTLLMVEEVVV